MSAAEFQAAMRQAGLEPPEVIEPGRMHRFPGVGRRNGDSAGWCRLFDDGRGGVFGDFASGLSEVWQAARSTPYTPAEHEAFMLKVEVDRREREERERQKHALAALEAKRLLEAATGDPAGHPYAARKGVPFGPRVRRGAWQQRQWDDALLVPIYNGDPPELRSLSAISPDGKKDYLSGGDKRGGFHPLGKVSGSTRVLVGEGLATVAVAHLVDGSPAVVALDAGGLLPVAEAVRKLAAPGAEIVIVADNDSKPDGPNVGLLAATAAARAVGGLVAVPELGGAKCDFWDVWHERGPDAVKMALEAAQEPAAPSAEPGASVTAGADWPEPQALTAKIEPELYPLDALPGTVRAAVLEVAAFAQAPVPLVAGSALAALSLAIQAHYDAQRAEKLHGPTGLFLLSIADSGERKTTCDGFFTKAIREYEETQAEAARPKLETYRAALGAWEAKVAGIKEKIRQLAKQSQQTGNMERALLETERAKPEAPRVARLLYCDVTPESLAHGLATRWPSGGVVSNEAALVLGSHGMGRDSAMRHLGLLNQLWDGAALTVDRRSTESFTVRGARLTVALQVQEPTLREFLARTGQLARGSGFIARFLTTWPETNIGHRPYAEPPANWPHLAAFHRRITEILGEPVPIDKGGALTPVMLPLAPDAKAAWVAYHDAIESELASGGELYDVRDVAAKSADNAARLAALFHVFEGGLGAIGIEAFEGASRIAAWHLHEARRFFGELALPAELADAVKLDTWLVEYCRRERTRFVPTREAQRLGPVRDRERLAAAWRVLEELDRARVVQDGRRKTIYLNPALVTTP